MYAGEGLVPGATDVQLLPLLPCGAGAEAGAGAGAGTDVDAGCERLETLCVATLSTVADDVVVLRLWLETRGRLGSTVVPGMLSDEVRNVVVSGALLLVVMVASTTELLAGIGGLGRATNVNEDCDDDCNSEDMLTVVDATVWDRTSIDILLEYEAELGASAVEKGPEGICEFEFEFKFELGAEMVSD